MFESLLRAYDKVVLGLFKSRGGRIENENQSPPIPGVIQVESTAVIAALFKADCDRQQLEYETRTSMTQLSRPRPLMASNAEQLGAELTPGIVANAGVGTVAGTSFITFNKPRSK